MKGSEAGGGVLSRRQNTTNQISRWPASAPVQQHECTTPTSLTTHPIILLQTFTFLYLYRLTIRLYRLLSLATSVRATVSQSATVPNRGAVVGVPKTMLGRFT